MGIQDNTVDPLKMGNYDGQVIDEDLSLIYSGLILLWIHLVVIFPSY